MGPKPVSTASTAAERASVGAAPPSPRRIGALVIGHGAREGGPGEGSSPSAKLVERPTFERVYGAEFDFVWRSLLLLGVESNAVEDAVQEVFSVVSRQLDKFEGRSSVRTWLFAILQRVAANQRRSRRRKPRPLEPLGDGPVCTLPTPQARLEAAESIDLVQRFCATLDAERRAVFVLALLEELPAPEVSSALGIPVNTVYSRVRYLREGLRRMLDGEEQTHG